MLFDEHSRSAILGRATHIRQPDELLSNDHTAVLAPFFSQVLTIKLVAARACWPPFKQMVPATSNSHTGTAATIANSATLLASMLRYRSPHATPLAGEDATSSPCPASLEP